eukprot:jgi/Hompol1/2388/HPOL_001446-RA
MAVTKTIKTTTSTVNGVTTTTVTTTTTDGAHSTTEQVVTTTQQPDAAGPVSAVHAYGTQTPPSTPPRPPVPPKDRKSPFAGIAIPKWTPPKPEYHAQHHGLSALLCSALPANCACYHHWLTMR